ncbi:FAD-dependent oxidoreductase [Halostella sp. JP-L12]|uniref:NAD(P)/FAD-dependent oxidoreductase n=1 Tax=Halostella TaxID=1843185 RepID=UPI000EF79E41|nr:MULTISPECIES: NAD(P)/FAD-dependent oxidoreductase [Halostella]NHN47385.1 FAD-dependent oxidoreductase [Halostella sp. JP-L12]
MHADVLIVGGGVAGLSAGIFTARAGLDTLVVSEGESILERNAHLENYPGFPAGIDARLFLRMTRDQAERAGVEFEEGRVTDLEGHEGTDRFEVTTEGGDSYVADRVVAASWKDASYLREIDVGVIDRGSKAFVDVEEGGRTDVDGVYAAGRIADEPHQTVVCAGHGSKVGLAVIHDSDANYYHDWVAPDGYFTERGIDLPPATEEIDEAERRERDEESREVLREYVEEPLDEKPTMHPSVVDDE